MEFGIVDTTFARVDMARFVLQEIRDSGRPIRTRRYTVPGVKDLPAACRKLMDNGCELIIALGMPGSADIDRECSNQASLGLIMIQALTGKHIVEVFVHEDEAQSDRELYDMAEDRARKHARNAIKLAFNRDYLEKKAGKGLRQGGPDAGPIRL